MLALPDEELVAHSAGSATATATAVASDVGLVLKTAAEPLVRELSNGSLQLGSQRFVLAAAPDSTAIRWVATPTGGQLGTDSPIELSSPAASIRIEQDDYILGGPSRSNPATPPVAKSQNGPETAVAMVWTEEDTVTFLSQMFANMSGSDKTSVVRMLADEYEPEVFGPIVETALEASLFTAGSYDEIVEGEPLGLSCECIPQTNDDAGSAK